jgi:hypothetical protein
VKAGEVKSLRFEAISRDGFMAHKVDLKELILFA